MLLRRVFLIEFFEHEHSIFATNQTHERVRMKVEKINEVNEMKIDARNQQKIAKIMVFLVLLTTVFFFASCSQNTSEQNDDINNEGTSNQTQQESLIRPDHEIDPNPEPLPIDQMDLSLEGYGAIGALTDTDLTLVDMLTYAVQDEYLAHGEYAAIIELYGNRNPYANIMASEEVHLSFLENVYNSYNIDFPADGSKDHLILPENLLEAAQTGVKAELDNIAMYERFLDYELPDNIRQVFEALKNGSESHLIAFQRQVDRLQ